MNAGFLVQEPGNVLDIDSPSETFQYVELRGDSADLEANGYSLSRKANLYPMVTTLPPKALVAHLPVAVQCGDEVIEVNSIDVSQLDLSEVVGMLKQRPLRVLFRRSYDTGGHELTATSSLNLPGRWEPAEKMWARGWLVRRCGNLDKDVHVEVLEDPMNSDTTGCNFIWPASLALARFVELLAVEQGWGNAASNGGTVSPLVVELGSGCGLVALTAAALGARVTATERRASMQTLQRSLSRNRIQIPVSAAVLEWGVSGSSGGNDLPMADLVLASDLTFSDELHQQLAVTLVELMPAGGTTCCWLAHDDSSKPGCWRQREHFFGPVCQGHGLVVSRKLNASAAVGHRWASKDVWIYQITREVPVLDLNSCD